MKSIDQLTPKSVSTLKQSAVPPAASGRDHVDAINQLFAELELAYHNQFHKAFAQEGSLALAKKYWLQSLAEFSPEVIRRATRHLVQHQQYLPTLAAMVSACEDAPTLFGLPTAEAAYREACLAPEPKADQRWSHPAVYHAAKATGWFALATEPQSAVLPLFEYHYAQCCRRVMQGERLEQPHLPALPEKPAAPLSAEQNRARMKALRQQFDL